MMKEYVLKFEEAKKINGFKVKYSMEFEDIKKAFNEHKEFDDMECLVYLELLNAHISLHYFDISDYSFVHYIKVSDDNLKTSGYSDLEICKGIFDNKDKFEELMFDLMMKHIKEENLYWSKVNNQLLVDKKVW